MSIITYNETMETIGRWAASLKVGFAKSKEGQKGDPVGEETATHFTKDATVNPTQSDALATKNSDVMNYFAHFCEKGPEPTILRANRFTAGSAIAAVNVDGQFNLSAKKEIVPCHWMVVVGRDEENGPLKFAHLHSSTQEHTLRDNGLSQDGIAIHRLFQDVAKYVGIGASHIAQPTHLLDNYVMAFQAALEETTETGIALGANKIVCTSDKFIVHAGHIMETNPHLGETKNRRFSTIIDPYGSLSVFHLSKFPKEPVTQMPSRETSKIVGHDDFVRQNLCKLGRT